MRIVPLSTSLPSSGAISPLNLLPGNPTMMYSTGPIAIDASTLECRCVPLDVGILHGDYAHDDLVSCLILAG